MDFFLGLVIITFSMLFYNYLKYLSNYDIIFFFSSMLILVFLNNFISKYFNKNLSFKEEGS